MRITLVTSEIASRGGAQRILCLLANAWAERSSEVTLLTFDDGTPSAYPLHRAVRHEGLHLFVESRNMLQSIPLQFWRLKVLRRAIRGSLPDIIVASGHPVNTHTVLATLGLGRPVIVSEFSDPRGPEIGWMWERLRRLAYRSADALVCNSRSSLAQFLKRTRAKGYVIPSMFTVPPEFMNRASRRSGSSQKHTLIALGRLSPEKGFDLLLRAFARVADGHPDWSLTIVGGGLLRSQLEEQAAELRLADRVDFSGDMTDPFTPLGNADLFVLPSRYEGFPLALCEAMACGLPAVSFDCPSGPNEIIRDGVDGILVPPEDVEAMATVLDRLMTNSRERQMMAARAPEVLERFSPDQTLCLWQKLIDELLAAQ